MNEVLKKVHANGSIYRIRIVWQVDSFELIVFEKQNAYQTLVTEDQLEAQASLLDLEIGRYYDKLKSYIAGGNDENSDVTVNVSGNSFVVKRQVGSVSIKYFQTDLVKTNYAESVARIIDELYEKNCEQSTQVDAERETTDRQAKQITKYQTKMEEFVIAKENSDKQMLSNFLLVLNEKKMRIRYLTDLLDAFNIGRQPRNPTLPTKKIKKEASPTTQPTEKAAVKRHTEELSDSEPDIEEEDYNSEEEKMITRDVQAEIEAIPSTSKCDNFNFLKADSPPRKVLIQPIIRHDTTGKSGLKVSPVKKVPSPECPRIEKMDIRESSPPLDFDTQELLDRL